jgi:hypothetical protein
VLFGIRNKVSKKYAIHWAFQHLELKLIFEITMKFKHVNNIYHICGCSRTTKTVRSTMQRNKKQFNLEKNDEILQYKVKFTDLFIQKPHMNLC